MYIHRERERGHPGAFSSHLGLQTSDLRGEQTDNNDNINNDDNTVMLILVLITIVLVIVMIMNIIVTNVVVVVVVVVVALVLVLVLVVSHMSPVTWCASYVICHVRFRATPHRVMLCHLGSADSVRFLISS